MPSASPTADKAPSASMPTEFRIINPAFVVEPWRHDKPLEQATLGVLADVPGYGRLARWERPGRCGPVYGFKRYDPNDPEREPEVLRIPLDEAGRVVDEPTPAGSGQIRYRRLEPTPRKIEFDKFEREYPLISAELGLARRRIVSRLDPGDVRVQTNYDHAAVGSVDWQSFVDKFTEGDFGIVGAYDPNVDMSPAANWTHDLHTRAVRNSRSVARRNGVVVAAYPLETAPKPGMVVLVRSVLSRLTLLTVRPGEHLPIE